LFRAEEWIHKPRVMSVRITSTAARRNGHFRELVHPASHVHRTQVIIRDPLTGRGNCIPASRLSAKGIGLRTNEGKVEIGVKSAFQRRPV
jgi:hypothetical protein